MNLRKLHSAALVLLILFSAGCKPSASVDSTKAVKSNEKIGAFSADTAYKYVAEQVAFGPRVPGTAAHDSCANYIVERLHGLGPDTVIVQTGTVTAFNGDVLPIKNIIAQYNKFQTKRILLAAHWDTRPWANRDDSHEKRLLPADGANDGGSGVGVLLEIARNLAEKSPSVGVDLFFIDAEDYGDSSGFSENSDTWCLGSQYWADNVVPYTADNMPVYGILLDMVGGRDARFNYEAFAQENATKPTVKVWSEAESLGYGERFPRSIGGAVTDDHVVLTRAGIPTTDIIELNNPETLSFPPSWHTHNDNLSNIDKETLQVVGDVVLNVVYKEKPF